MTKTLFEFDPESHIYSYGGDIIPSVTQLLQEFGLIDFSQVPKSRLEYKRVLGIAVHYAIQLHNADNLDEGKLDKRILPYFLAYKKFTEIYKFEPRHTELRMYSKKMRCAGTLDLQGLLNYNDAEVETILDIKCSWILYPSNKVQLSGYKAMYEENYKTKIKKIFSLKLNQNGNFDLVEHQYDYNTFISMVILHYWKKENLNANQKDMPYLPEDFFCSTVEKK
jgi:hypothetical protein